MNERKVSCDFCHHSCQLSEGQRGVCGVRECRHGRMESLVYGRLVAQHVDPIEKKPLYHVRPGSLTYSLATLGCNFRCRHCQNSSISQVSREYRPPAGQPLTPAGQVVANALASGCKSISYTYVEPTVFSDYALDCAVAGKAAGLGNIFVSNGYMSAELCRRLSSYLLAINIDLKAFSDSFYRRVCGARLQPVLDSIKLFHQLGVWIEVTTLIIPGLNDTVEELQALAGFLAGIDKDMVWHVSGFSPSYQMRNVPPTPIDTLVAAAEIGREAGLHHVYTGNRLETGWEDTHCPHCRARLVCRQGHSVLENRLREGCCPDCGTVIAGRW